MNKLSLSVLQVPVRVNVDRQTCHTLERNYSSLVIPDVHRSLSDQLDYCTSFNKSDSTYYFTNPDGMVYPNLSQSEFIYLFEKDLTINLQKRRPELFFLHAAALQLENCVILIIGKSGAGKSTTCWALTHHGFSYLSDELSPINPDNLQVEPYSHAICLKNLPPKLYALPAQTLVTDYTMHIPTEYFSGGVTSQPAIATHIFFVEYNINQQSVHLERISGGDGAILLYTNALNQLSHDADGLPAASRIAGNCQCYDLRFSDVYDACVKIRNLIREDCFG